MSKLMSSCIICSGETNLNTTMDVKQEDAKYTVSICTTCEDEASPKKVREALLLQLEKFKKLIEDAKGLGVTLTLDQLTGTGKGLLVAKPAVAPAPVAQPTNQAIPTAPTQDRLTDERGNLKPAVNYSVTHQVIPPPYVDSRVHTSQDKANMPGIAIPSKMVGNTGTTYVSVHKMSSSEMQERFRRQAMRSMGGEDISQYRECQTCGGQGMTGTKKQPVSCKACDGTGHQKA